MSDIVLTPSEEQIINIIRHLRPHERLEVMADASGKPDTYVITQMAKRMVFPTKQVFMQVKSAYFTEV